MRHGCARAAPAGFFCRAVVLFLCRGSVRRLFGLESTLDGQGFGSFSDCSFSGLDFVVVWLAQFFFGIPLIKSMPKIGWFCAEKEPLGRVGDGNTSTWTSVAFIECGVT